MCPRNWQIQLLQLGYTRTPDRHQNNSWKVRHFRVKGLVEKFGEELVAIIEGNTDNFVHLIWVPGHAGVDGNEWADKVAEEGGRRNQSEADVDMGSAFQHLWQFTARSHDTRNLRRRHKANRLALQTGVWGASVVNSAPEYLLVFHGRHREQSTNWGSID